MSGPPPKRGVLDHLVPPVSTPGAKLSPDAIKAEARAGWTHFQAGRLADAERHGRRILDQNPRHAEALDLLGLVAFRSGDLSRALAYIDRAASAEPKNPTVQVHRGIVLGASGQLRVAVDVFRAALKMRPDNAEAHYNLGLALAKLGDDDAAVAAYRQAVKHQPRHLSAHHNLGATLRQKGELDAAEQAFRRTVEIEPRFIEGHESLATILLEQGRGDDAVKAAEQGLRIRETAPLRYALGRVRESAGRFEEAAKDYRRAMELDPKMLGARVNLGNVLRELEHDEEAWTLNKESVRLHPDSSGILNNYALSLLACTRSKTPPAPAEELHAEALIAIRKALAIAPTEPGLQFTHAAVLDDAGRDEEALRVLEPLIEAHPDMGNAQYMRRMIELRLGRDDAGRDAFRWYWALPSHQDERRPFPQPAWNGETISPGRRLLVWADQGVGDEIVNMGFAPELARRGIDVVLECDPRLVDLARRSWPAIQVMGRTTTPNPALVAADIAYQCPLSQLMAWLGPWPDGFPRRPRILTPDPARVRDLRGRLDAIDPGGLKIGISWRSRRAARTLQRVPKSIEILDWEPILTRPGVQFVNLQYDETDEDIALVRDRLGVTIHSVPDLDRMNDVDGMMALTAGLDLVITISNVSAHFAGAVGTTCWVMARKSPFWYWRAQGETAAIYDSVRVIRQARSGEWAAVIGEVAAALESKLVPARPAE